MKADVTFSANPQLRTMADDSADVLYISYRSPDYVRVTLPRLLDTLSMRDRLWVWHNGKHEETLAAVREFTDHPNIYKFHHSPENLFVRGPTNWMWSSAEGRYLAKVDDDALLRVDWLDRLKKAHESNPKFGVIGCWRFLESDFDSHLSKSKMATFNGGVGLLRNLWVEGSGYLMKRECLDELGQLDPNQGFSSYCIELGRRGWTNGWLYPFVLQEDLDDPRGPNTMVRTDAELMSRLPLGAIKQGISTLEAWAERRHQAALEVQRAPLDPRAYSGWRLKMRRALKKLRAWKSVRSRPRWNPNW